MLEKPLPVLVQQVLQHHEGPRSCVLCIMGWEVLPGLPSPHHIWLPYICNVAVEKKSCVSSSFESPTNIPMIFSAREVRGEQKMLSEDSQAPSPQHVSAPVLS